MAAALAAVAVAVFATGGDDGGSGDEPSRQIRADTTPRERTQTETTAAGADHAGARAAADHRRAPHR